MNISAYKLVQSKISAKGSNVFPFPAKQQRITDKAAMVDWQQRQAAWLGYVPNLTYEDQQHLKRGGFIKDERIHHKYCKIISCWISHGNNVFEQRAEYRFVNDSELNPLGIKSIHLQRTARQHYRIGIECINSSHYAAFYELIDGRLPVQMMQRWAMLPYFFEFDAADKRAAHVLLDLLEVSLTNSFKVLIKDLRGLF